MKRLTFLATALLILAIGLSPAQAANWYFDQNDDAAGSGVLSQVYNWTTDGSGAGPGFWNTNNADGTQASPGLNTALWVNGNDAVFSAGTDATGVTYGLSIGAGVTASSVAIEEGTVQISVGPLNVGAGSVTISPNAALRTIASSQFTTGLTFKLQGTNTADAAWIQGANPGSAGSLLTTGGGLSTVEINGFGRISYDDGDGTPDNKVSIMSSQVITGLGGTPTNGGAGTLIKSGPDQLGYAVKDTGGGVMNFTLNSFKYLRVEQGSFRLRNTGGVIDERLFGAVPLATLPDAITLDGGGIGSNLTVTLDANRGITITANGGYLDHGATAGLNIPGPITGSGALTIGDPTSTNVANDGPFTLSNANNVNTFSGDLIGLRGVLNLNSSLKVNALSDGSTTQQPTNQSTITIASGQTLTTGVSNGGGTWSRPIGGAGGLTKMGSGTETLTGANTYSGDTKVQGGTLSISNAYLADAADVYLTTGSTFNLNFAGSDAIDSLFIDNVQQATGTWGGAGSGATHISALLSGTGILSVGPPPGITGDYNNDGKVDAGDYVTWKKAEGTTNVLANDPIGGTIGAGQYNNWRANFGKPPGAGSGGGLSGGAVPEPASLGLVVVGLAALGFGRRGRVA